MKHIIFFKNILSREKLFYLFKINCIVILLGINNNSDAANITTTGTGSWSSTTSNQPWPGGIIPGTGDNIIIGANFTLTVDGDRTCASIKIGNGSTLTINSTKTLTVTGALTFPNISASDVTGTLNGTGTVSCASFNVGDATTSSGSNHTYTTIITSTVSTVTISGNLTVQSTANGSRLNNVTFNFQSGTITVSGSVVTTNGTNNVSTLTLASGAQTGILSIGGSTPFNISGTGTSTITLNGTSSTVNYSGSAQAVRATTYTNLTLSGSGAKTMTLSGLTVNGNLSMSGSATATTPGTMTIGSLSLSSTSQLTLGGALTVTGNVAINGGTTFSTSSSNYALTLKGDFTNSGTFTAGSSSITIDGISTQNIDAFTTTGTVSMTKTGGTATFNGNVSGGALTINGSGGTLNLGTSLTHTFTGTWTMGNNSTLNGGSSALKLASGFSGSGTYTFTANTGTVEWNASANQAVAAVTYNNLTLSGSGAKTLTGITVNGNLSMSGSATATTPGTMTVVDVSLNSTSQLTLGGALTATGNVTINGGTILTISNNALTLGGNLTNSGTFTAGSSSITINGSGTQTISGFTTTGNVTATNSGAATFSGDVTAGALTVNCTSSGSLDLGTSHTHTFSGTLTLTNGALNCNSSTLKLGAGVSGTLTNFTKGTGTVNYYNSGQTIAEFDYNNLDLTNASTITFPTGTVAIYGTFTPASITSATQGTINFKSSSQTIPAFDYYNLNLTSATGTSFPSGTIGIAGTFTPASITSASQGTVNFKGSSQTIPAFDYYNLNLTGATGTSFPSGTVGIAGTFTPASITSASQGTVNFKGSSQTIPAFDYYNLNLTSATGTSFPSGTVGIAGTFTPASITSASQGTINFKGSSQTVPVFNYYNLNLTSASGTSFASGTVGIAGTFTPASITSASQGTINFKGSSQTIPAFEYYNLDLTNASSISFPSGTVGIAGTFTPATVSSISTGTINFNGGSQTIAAIIYNNLTLSVSGTKTISGVTVNGILSMEGSATVSTAPTYGSSATLKYNTSMTSGFEWIATFVATGGVVINSGTVTLDAAKTFNSGTPSVPLTINTGATLTTNNYGLTLGGDFINNGTFTGGSSSVTINGSVAQNIDIFSTTGIVSVTTNGATATFTRNISGGGLTVNCTSSGTLNLGTSHTHTFSGAMTLTSGTLNCGSSTLKLGASVSGSSSNFVKGTGTVNYYGSGQTIAGFDYNNLDLTNASTITFPAGTVRISGTFTPASIVRATQGTINFKGSSQTVPAFSYYNLDFTGASGTLALSATGTIKIEGSFTPALVTTVGGTVNFIGTGQTIPAINYGNLDLTGATSILFSSGTTGISDVFTPTGPFANAGTIDFNGIGSQTIPVFTYFNLSTSVPSHTSVKTLGGAITANGNITIGSGTTLDVSSSNYSITVLGNWTNNGTFNSHMGIVTFSANLATQTINNSTSSFSFLVHTGTGALKLSASLIVVEGLSNNSGGLDFNNYNVTLGGSFHNDALFITGINTTTFDGSGSSVQRIEGGGFTAFYNVVINNNSSSGIVLSRDVSINGGSNALTFTNGVIHTGSNILTLGTSVTISGAGSTKYVDGNLKITIPTGSSVTRTFAIGDNSKYCPVSITLASVSVGGDITASTTGTEHSQVIGSTINQDKNVNRYWTLTRNASLTFTTYDIVFNFNSTDVDAGASTSSFEIEVYSSLWTRLTHGTQTSTSTQATGVNKFGDFVIGENGTRPAISTDIFTNPASGVCVPNSILFSASSNSVPTSTAVWQIKTSGVFTNLTISSPYSVNTTSSGNTTTSELTINPTAASLQGKIYRVVFTNNKGSVVSSEKPLNLCEIIIDVEDLESTDFNLYIPNNSPISYSSGPGAPAISAIAEYSGAGTNTIILKDFIAGSSADESEIHIPYDNNVEITGVNLKMDGVIYAMNSDFYRIDPSNPRHITFYSKKPAEEVMEFPTNLNSGLVCHIPDDFTISIPSLYSSFFPNPNPKLTITELNTSNVIISDYAGYTWNSTGANPGPYEYVLKVDYSDSGVSETIEIIGQFIVD